MSLSSNTAQTRELTELRNHLKWLDEERRKSGRKMAELEQRLAQQGRELADRDQKIQELEWHVANFAERFERMPDLDTNVAGTEQRIQDLEWHLSNMNAQLTRLPNMEEERTRWQEEISRAVRAAQERFDSEQSILESRLRTEIVSVRQSDEQRTLLVRQDEQSQAIIEVEHRLAMLQENVTTLSSQLQETTGTLAADSQTRINNLAAESQTNISALAAGLQQHLQAMAAENQTRIDALTAEWQTRMDEALATRTEEPSIDVLRLDEQLTEVAQNQQQWQFRWSQFEQDMAQLGQQIEQVNSQIEPLNARQLVVDQLAGQLEPLNARQNEIEQVIAQLREEFGTNLQPLSARQIEHEQVLAQLRDEFRASLEPLNVRQVELEDNLAKLGHVREVMPLLDRLEQELELRQAEEVRLSNLIGTQENRFAPLATSLEEITATNNMLVERMAESERLVADLRSKVQEFNALAPVVSEVNQRMAPLSERLSMMSNNLMKAEAGIQALTGDQAEFREIVTNLSDDMRQNQSDVARQLEGWQAMLDENKDTIERFTQQWITLSNQYKEARMAVQNFAHWQKQLEQQKREASEMLRVESNRMQSRWDGFLLEVQEKLKNFELDLNQKWQSFELENDQKWSAARRNEQLRHEELAAVDELIQKLQQDNRNLIWRVQAAQADAIKKWPRLLMEEVEKAVEINPNRRLVSNATPRADMSVVDAIEQGLITIDYNDENPIDL